MNVHTNLSIITVCIPFLKPIVESLSLGIVNENLVTTSIPSTSSAARTAASLRTFYGWTRLHGGDRHTTTVTANEHGMKDGRGKEREGRSESMNIHLAQTTTVLSEQVKTVGVV